MEPEDYLVELNTAQMTEVTGAPVYRDGGVGTGGVTEVNAFSAFALVIPENTCLLYTSPSPRD